MIKKKIEDITVEREREEKVMLKRQVIKKKERKGEVGKKIKEVKDRSGRVD